MMAQTFANPFKRLKIEDTPAPFDCGEKDLNDYFMNDSKNYLSKLLAVTYSFERDGKTVVFFSLSNDKISASEHRHGHPLFSSSFFRKIKGHFDYPKHRSDYPAVKIGRLGVHKEYQMNGEHWGQLTLDFIKWWMINDNKTGCCFITVDAYATAVGFYLKNGFEFMGSGEQKAYEAWRTAIAKNLDDIPTFAMYYNLLKLQETL